MRYATILLIAVSVSGALGCAGSGERPGRGLALPAGDVENGKEAFVELRCHACHEVEGLDAPAPVATPQVDVELGGLAMREPTDGELLTAIVNPSHTIIPGREEERVMSGTGSRMADYREVMTVQQLIDLVAYLHSVYSTAR